MMEKEISALEREALERIAAAKSANGTSPPISLLRRPAISGLGVVSSSVSIAFPPFRWIGASVSANANENNLYRTAV